MLGGNHGCSAGLYCLPKHIAAVHMRADQVADRDGGHPIASFPTVGARTDETFVEGGQAGVLGWNAGVVRTRVVRPDPRFLVEYEKTRMGGAVVSWLETVPTRDADDGIYCQ